MTDELEDALEQQIEEWRACEQIATGREQRGTASLFERCADELEELLEEHTDD